MRCSEVFCGAAGMIGGRNRSRACLLRFALGKARSCIFLVAGSL